MRPDGCDVVARWREAGEWWNLEPSREVVRLRDAAGVVREETRELPSLGHTEPHAADEYVEDHTEEWSLRVRKRRDEKVAVAVGALPRETVLPERLGKGRMSDHYLDRSLPSSSLGLRIGKSTSAAPWVPLHVFSGYAFGRSCTLAEEIPVLAREAGCPAVAIADPHSLVGAVEFVRAARKVGVKPLVGVTIELPEGGEIVLIARSKRGYENLSQLVTACHLGEPRLFPLGSWERLERYSRDVICLTGGDLGPLDRLLTRHLFDEARALVARLAAVYGTSNVFVEIERSYLPWERSVGAHLLALAEETGLTPVAGGAITHARRDRFPAQDILVCAQTLCTVDEIIGRKPRRAPTQPPLADRPERALNAERFFRTSSEIASLFADRPDLVENTRRVADRCDDDVLPARTQLPELYSNPGHVLREVVYQGAHARYPNLVPRLRRRIDLEIERIVRLDFAQHFLVAWDACGWARSQGILFSGRGSVVDSVVAYCLGLSRIDADAHRLHFDRFLPDDGSKRPDIDLDFEAKRRDDVRNYLIRRYGPDRVATVAAIGAYCSRGIIREVGKAMGLPESAIGFLAKRVHGGISPDRLESALESRPELRESGISKERFRWVFRLAEQLMDVPRNMRCHSSGVVISSRPLAETVPVQWSAGAGTGEEDWSEPNLRIVQWDKRSAKHFFDKFDILCLRGQDVLAGAERRIRLQEPSFNVEQISLEDPEVYRTMRSGELIGIPQSASPAMRQAHIRIRTQDLTDASLVQAGIRPGVGGAVKINELIARRRGKPYSFLHPEMERILGLTYGIIVFQEQVDQLLQSFAGYSSGEAEDIRDAIHKRRREDFGRAIQAEIIARVRERGFGEAIADHVYELVAGFKGYGFAQGHALAFAEISLRSVYCQQNFPAEYFASLLSAQPAGYYGPCTLCNEARTRGVRILGPDVNASFEQFSVEDVRSEDDPQWVFPSGGIRVGLMQVAGLSKETRERIVAAGPVPDRFASFFDGVARVRPNRDELERLILCGAFDSAHPNRRALLWAIPDALAYSQAMRPYLDGDGSVLPLDLPEPALPTNVDDFNEVERAIHERRILGLDVRRHLMRFERERVAGRGGIAAAQAKALEPGRKAIVVGNPIRLRFPPTPSGKRVVFFDLEDETGLLNVTCFDAAYRRDGHAIVCSPYVTILGEAQDRDGHTAFLAHRVFPYRPVLLALGHEREDRLPIVTRDFLVG